MKYQVGDMLKVKYDNDFAFCVITEQESEDSFSVFWIIEKGYITNGHGYKTWTTSVLNTEFMRLS